LAGSVGAVDTSVAGEVAGTEAPEVLTVELAVLAPLGVVLPVDPEVAGVAVVATGAVVTFGGVVALESLPSSFLLHEAAIMAIATNPVPSMMAGRRRADRFGVRMDFPLWLSVALDRPRLELIQVAACRLL
jgi:hypothetical protein